MYQKQSVNRLWIILGLGIFCIGMGLAAFLDLPLTASLYRPTQPAAIWMECFGFYPIYLPAALWLFSKLFPPACGKVRISAFLALGALLIFLWQYSISHLVRRGVSHAFAITVPVWISAIAILAVLYICFVRRNALAAAKLRFCAWFGTVYLASHCVLIYVLKTIWSRTRFEDMLAAGNFEAFTSWLSPFGNGGSSFPSGHTAAACGIFVLAVLCDLFPSWNRHRFLVWAGCWLYVGCMAFSRLMMGRHFLSDTLAAGALMAALFLILTHTAWYKQSAEAVCRQGETHNE